MTQAELIKDALAPLRNDITNLREELKADVNSIKEELKTFIEVFEKKVDDKIQKVETSLNTAWEHIRFLTEKLDNQEAQDRRNNVVIHGIPEPPRGETWEDVKHTVINICKENGVNIEPRHIQRAHRLFGKNRPRPVIVKFAFYDDKENVVRLAKSVAGLRFAQDITNLTKKRRNGLRSIQQAAFDAGKRTFFRQDRLIVGKLTFDTDPLFCEAIRVVLPNGEKKRIHSLEEALVWINAEGGRDQNTKTSKRLTSDLSPPSAGLCNELRKQARGEYSAAHENDIVMENGNVMMRDDNVMENGQTS